MPTQVVSPAAPAVEALARTDATVAVAESVTGGLVLSMLTDVPGASQVLDRGLVAYTPQAKAQALGVDRGLLDDAGPISRPVAAAMAEGIRQLAGATWGLATTGIAGPSGGTEATPVGTVFLAVAGPDGTEVQRHRLEGDRWTVRRGAAKRVLASLTERLLEA